MLAPSKRTQQLIKDAIESKCCCKCGKPAKRFVKEQYLCHYCAQPENTIPLSEYEMKICKVMV